MKHITPDMNPASIRNYHFIHCDDGKIKVQFIGIGDRHRMMKRDDGSIAMIKEGEKGKPFRYGAPYEIDEALAILDQGTFRTHKDIAAHIRDSRPA